MFSKFLLGRLHAKPEVCRVLGRMPLDLVARHAVCDFGNITTRRFKQNLIALNEGDEIQSEYLADPTNPAGGRIRITTCNGWSDTEIAWIAPQPTKE